MSFEDRYNKILVTRELSDKEKMSGACIREGDKIYLCGPKPQYQNPDLPVKRKITKVPKKCSVRVLTPRHEQFSRGKRGS